MNLEEMNDMLKNGVVSNMCNYIRAREIFLTISDFHQKINDSPYNEFFGAVQLFAKKEMYMSLCKIFEEKNKIYVICSLPNILDILKNSELEKLEELAENLKKELPTNEELEEIKQVRDKMIAHNEKPPKEIQPAQLKIMDELLEKCKSIVVKLQEQKELNLMFFDLKNKFILEEQAKTAARALEELLTNLDELK